MTDVFSLYSIPLPQVTGGHLAQVTGGGGGVVNVYEQRSVLPLLLIPHTSVSGLIIPFLI